MRQTRWVALFIITLAAAAAARAAEAPHHEAELIFPLDARHNHAPGVAECPNGDLLVSWYRGSGERSADDVAVYGARLRKGEKSWSEPFLLADTPQFPDCNTCLMIDGRDRLWLFWPLVLANSWESCLTQYRISDDYQSEGPPQWSWQGSIPLVPVNFEAKMLRTLDELADARGKLSPHEQLFAEHVRKTLKDKLSHRLGWQPRCKPTVLADGRIVLPLYTDTYSVSLMAISDDGGQSWRASEPLCGFGNIQPAVLERRDGTLVAYMRENGPLEKIRVCESTDRGDTWGPVGTIDLPNPGSGLDGVRLANGRWLLVYNDTTKGRNQLAVSISDDEGQSWRWTRHLEKRDQGAFHYPCVIQGRDGTIHFVYSFFADGGKSMKHAAVNEAWVQAGD